jgi:hypothetical protein
MCKQRTNDVGPRRAFDTAKVTRTIFAKVEVSLVDLPDGGRAMKSGYFCAKKSRRIVPLPSHTRTCRLPFRVCCESKAQKH